MAVIAVVGAGVMGTALTWPLADNGHQVRLVGTHLDEEIIESYTYPHPLATQDNTERAEDNNSNTVGDSNNDNNANNDDNIFNGSGGGSDGGGCFVNSIISDNLI